MGNFQTKRESRCDSPARLLAVVWRDSFNGKKNDRKGGDERTRVSKEENPNKELKSETQNERRQKHGRENPRICFFTAIMGAAAAFFCGSYREYVMMSEYKSFDACFLRHPLEVL